MPRPNNERKARQNESFDFVDAEQRKHRRFGSSAFEGIPVVLKPAPPFFGNPVDGKMVDLSGGGAAVLMNEAVLVNTKMKVWIAIPGREPIDCRVSVRRCSPNVAQGVTRYLTGLQFLDLNEDLAEDLARMSDHYDACEKRIAINEPPICIAPCAFFELCDKPQKAA